MTNEQILHKAIKKAIKSGFQELGGFFFDDCKVINKDLVELTHNSRYSSGYKKLSVNDIIFSHDFVKSFWGEKLISIHIDKYLDPDGLRATIGTAGTYIKFIIPAWQYHLQQMVLEKEPLQYIKKFL